MASYSEMIPIKRETFISLCFALYMIAIRTVRTVKRLGGSKKVKSVSVAVKATVEAPQMAQETDQNIIQEGALE